MSVQCISDRPFREPIDWLVFCVVSLIGGGFALYVMREGVQLLMVDQYSHLAIARQITDSMTPGLSQLGFWPPLVHMVMAPFASIGFLYESGLAAPLSLVPILALSAVYLFRLALLIGVEKPLAAAAVAAYVLNPYTLYYAVTPMSDTLFIALLIIASYYLAHWWLTERLASLIAMGGAGALATLARFEGFFLIFFAGLAVMARLAIGRASLAKIEAGATMYGLVAGLGVLFILLYGLTFAGDPLEFMNNEWGAYAQQRSLFLPTEHNLRVSLQYLMAASEAMLGSPLILMGLFAGVLVLLLGGRRNPLLLAVMTLLLSPFLFDLFALFQGSAVIYVPELPPYGDRYFNERYGLYWIAFLVITPVLAASLLYHRMRSWGWFVQPAALLVAATIALVPVVSSYALFTEVACRGCFHTVHHSLQSSPPDQRVIAEILRDEYDGGRILMTRALHNEVAVSAGVPLAHYILEANEHYFDQSLKYPWLFADWVIMQNTAWTHHSDWSRSNERVSLLWTDNDEFERFYDPVYVGQGSILYRLDREEVYAYALKYGLPQRGVPTLDPVEGTWDVERTFQELDRRIVEYERNNLALFE